METATATPNESLKPLGWAKSFLWLALAIACFHAAYTSLRFPPLGLLIFSYAFALARLTNQPTVRRAFYFGLAAGFFCYGPQLWFFFKIFSVAAVVLWLVLAFWVGLFTAIVYGCTRRWGQARAVWLIPIVWTGIEYFRSELYLLRFSWLNIGYAMPARFSGGGLFHLGMYGIGFIVFLVAAVCAGRFATSRPFATWAAVVVALGLLVSLPVAHPATRPAPTVVGIQMEFPPAHLIPKMLNQALAKNTNAQIFVLSEYTLDGPVPDSLKNWCREHSRFLVVGGKDPAGANHYHNTAFVVGANGQIVFQQGKCVPIQFFSDGLPAPDQHVWDSPWGKIGFCVCYDLSYTRVTDELVRQGAQLLIVPTMDVESWSRHEHELHTRVAPVRAAEYGIPIFRLSSSGISQAITPDGIVIAQAPMPGSGAVMAASLGLTPHPALPLDRYLAPLCTGSAALITAALLFLTWTDKGSRSRI